METTKYRYISNKSANTKWFACPICRVAREEYYSYEQHKTIYEYYPEVPTYGKEKVVCDKCLD